MTLAEVCKLVGDNRGKLLLCCGIQKQPGVHSDNVAGHRKRIERRAVNYNQRQALVLQGNKGHQAVDNAAHVIGDQRIPYLIR